MLTITFAIMSESSFNNADQRNAPKSETLQDEKQREFKAGQPNSHDQLDPSKTSLPDTPKPETITNTKQRMRDPSRTDSQPRR